MTHVLLLIAAILVTSAAGNEPDKKPFDESITLTGKAACEYVKQFMSADNKQETDKSEPDLEQLSVNFYSNAIPESYYLTSAAELIRLSNGYDPNRKLLIFLHGFIDDSNQDTIQNMITTLLSKGEYNILALDCSSLRSWLFVRCSSYVRFIGEKLGQIFAAMVDGGMRSSEIHLVGHSVGAHIASVASKTFTILKGGHVGRITGLDPAGPCFTNLPSELRLKKTDADFVDVIHTDISVFGLKDPIGHADFYVNGGFRQPKCLTQTCSHNRAVELFAESIDNKEAFTAVSCRNWESFKLTFCDEIKLMGSGCDRDTRGMYFLLTGEKPPYGLGINGILYDDGEVNIKDDGKPMLPILPSKPVY